MRNKMQCFPQHKIRYANYNVQIIINEVEDEVVDINCKDCKTGRVFNYFKIFHNIKVRNI